MACTCSEGSRVLVVEDAVHGLVSARAAGAYAVGVTTSLPRELLEPHADEVVGGLLDLIPRLALLVAASGEI
jgi:dual specificity phosphatase 12